MRSVTTAKIIPGIILAICAFFLAFWYASSQRTGRVTERVPIAAEPATTQQPTPTAQSSQQPANTSTQPGTPQATGGSVAPGFVPPALPGAWPRFRGANFDNISTENTPLADKWNPGEPKVYWSCDLGEGHAGAAVLSGRVYVLDYDQARQADALRCLSLADGREIWRYSYPVSIKRNHGMSRTVPAVTDKFVVTIGPKCQVSCVDSQTGKLIWMKDLVKEFGTEIPEWYAGQCPLIDGNKAIIAPGGSALMVAIDCAMGKVLWQTPNQARWKMTHSSIIPMTVSGVRTYIYCASGGIVGVSADNGAILWQTPDWKVTIANVPTPVVIGSDKVFLCGGYNSGSMMLQIKNTGGKLVPQTLFRLKPTVFGSDQQTPIFYKGYIYGVIPGGQMACLDTSGRQVWNSGASRFGLGPYIIADGKIFVVSDDGVLTMAKATNAGYQQLSQARILNGPDSWGPMALAGGRLIARDITKMVCLDIAKH